MNIDSIFVDKQYCVCVGGGGAHSCDTHNWIPDHSWLVNGTYAVQKKEKKLQCKKKKHKLKISIQSIK